MDMTLSKQYQARRLGEAIRTRFNPLLSHYLQLDVNIDWVTGRAWCAGLNLDFADATLWLGMLRQIVWKLA